MPVEAPQLRKEQPIGVWVPAVDKQDGFAVLTFSNRLNNGSLRRPGDEAVVRFDPRFPDGIFNFSSWLQPRLVATPSELKVLLEGYGLRSLPIPPEPLFEDLNRINSEISLLSGDFARLYHTVVNAVPELLQGKVTCYMGQDYSFLAGDLMVLGRTVAFQSKRPQDQRDEIMKQLNDLFLQNGDFLQSMNFQGREINVYKVSDELLETKINGDLTTQVFWSGSPTVDVRNIVPVPARAKEIMDNWHRVAGQAPSPELSDKEKLYLELFWGV